MVPNHQPDMFSHMFSHILLQIFSLHPSPSPPKRGLQEGDSNEIQQQCQELLLGHHTMAWPAAWRAGVLNPKLPTCWRMIWPISTGHGMHHVMCAEKMMLHKKRVFGKKTLPRP